jgi:DNA-binding response OmpR family regulator
MPDVKPKLLIIEDDLDVAEMLDAYFRVQDYEVITVNRGKDGIKASQVSRPDLIILNLHIGDMDGYKVIQKIQKASRSSNIPFIFLIDKSERMEQLAELGLGVLDCINKPFDVQELRLRVRNALRRATQDSLTNPVTGLPEGLVLDEHLNDCLESSTWTMLIASLKNLDDFREIYGFVASDDVLRAVSFMIQNAVLDLGTKNDFLGHLSPTDFVLITQKPNVTPLVQKIQSRVGQSLGYFYPIKDRDKSMEKGKRIGFTLGVLHSEEEFFPSLAALKKSLLKKKQ